MFVSTALDPYDPPLHVYSATPHSRGVAISRLSSCDIVPVPILGDNYSYLIVDTATRQAAAIDPSDPTAVLAAAEQARRLTLQAAGELEPNPMLLLCFPLRSSTVT